MVLTTMCVGETREGPHRLISELPCRCYAVGIVAQSAPARVPPCQRYPFPVPLKPLSKGGVCGFRFAVFLSARLGVDARPNTGLVRLPGSDPHRQALRVCENGRGAFCVADCQLQSVSPAPPPCQAVLVLALGGMEAGYIY